ncbi:hypothetical protein MASR2M39_16280 [Ignavibacteriales bacterium]
MVVYNDLIGIVLILLVVLIAAYPLGNYISRVFKGEPVFTDFMRPFEEKIYHLCGIDSRHEMDWKANAKALLRLNAIFFVWAFIVLVTQGATGILNPANIVSMDPFLAFNMVPDLKGSSIIMLFGI